MTTCIFAPTGSTGFSTLSLHDALPICLALAAVLVSPQTRARREDEPIRSAAALRASARQRSEEHTSELQSRLHLVCRLLLEKKKTCRCAPTGCSRSARGLSASKTDWGA